MLKTIKNFVVFSETDIINRIAINNYRQIRGLLDMMQASEVCGESSNLSGSIKWWSNGRQKRRTLERGCSR